MTSRWKYSRLGAAFVVALMLVWSGIASATTVKFLDLADLITVSDVIVRGTISNERFVYDEARHNVMTHYTVNVTTSYFGTTSKELEFVQWGGEYQGMVSRIPGDASFQRGEDAVLFLNEDKGTLYLAALGQSKYEVKTKAGVSTVTRALSDIGFLIEGEEMGRNIIHKEDETAELLSFVAEMETLIAAIKGGSK